MRTFVVKRLTYVQNFTCQDFVFREPISLNLDYTLSQYLAQNFHASETKSHERLTLDLH